MSKAARDAAGARYAAALAELCESMIELSALDIVADRRMGGVRTFRAVPDSIPWDFRHPEYAPSAGADMRELAKARAAVLARNQEIF